MAYLFTLVLLALLFLQSCHCSQGTDFTLEPVQIIEHTLPSGLQAVNGSDEDGDCRDITSQSNGLRVCEDPNGIGFAPRKSVLVDGTTPTLDFSDDNWAEGFFTVRKNGRTMIELGFELDTNDNITQVELESLECPDRGIGAPVVSLLGMVDPGGFIFPSFGGTTTLLDSVTPEATSCSVQTHTFCIPMGEQPYRYYYLVFTFFDSSTDWLFLAEVRFLVNSPTTTSVILTTSVTPSTSIAPSTPSPQSLSSTIPTPTPPSGSGTPTLEPPQKEAGESCIDISGLVVCVTVVVLAAVISIVVHIAICMSYQLSQRQRCGQTTNGAPQEAIYEDMEGEEAAGLKMKGNEAYGFVPPGGGRVNNPPQSTAL